MSKGKDQEKLKWFKEARFGLFIHWGVYSLIGRGEWVKYQEQMPDEEYAEYAPGFKAQNYHPEEWVKLAKEAGMKYMVLTTKHHDGYCLFNTKTTDFNSAKIGPHKDLVAEYVRACRKHRIKIGFYYSLPDWTKPAFFKGPDEDSKGWREFIEYIHTQVKELCTQYGKIDILWYDYMIPRDKKIAYSAGDWQSARLNSMVRKYQPAILINNRSGLPEG